VHGFVELSVVGFAYIHPSRTSRYTAHEDRPRKRQISFFGNCNAEPKGTVSKARRVRKRATRPKRVRFLIFYDREVLLANASFKVY